MTSSIQKVPCIIHSINLFTLTAFDKPIYTKDNIDFRAQFRYSILKVVPTALVGVIMSVTRNQNDKMINIIHGLLIPKYSNQCMLPDFSFPQRSCEAGLPQVGLRYRKIMTIAL